MCIVAVLLRVKFQLSNMARVGIVGAGISGLVSAYLLTKAGVKVVLYEKDYDLDNNAKIVTVDGVDLDLEMLAFNQVTCPNTMEFIEMLGVDVEISDMSFSFSLDKGNGFEWGTRNGLSSVFAQNLNALNPFFLRMLREFTKFKNDVIRYLEEAENNKDIGFNETLWDITRSHGYSELFINSYLVPICSALFSCPAEAVLRLSAFTCLSYIRDHHLFQLFNGLQWLTVRGGSQSYIEKIKNELQSRGCQVITGCAVQSVSKLDDGCLIVCEDGSQEKYSGCIIDADVPDTLRMLGEQATYEEKRILGAFNYVYSDVYLHRDVSLMPRNQTTWSALNFVGTGDNKVCLTYWLNVLQNIDDKGLPFLVTHNPSRKPESILRKWKTERPVPSVASSKASNELHLIQGNRGIWFCGPYQSYGFCEGRVKAGMVAANGMYDKSCEILNNPRHMVLSLMENGARAFLVGFLQNYIAMGTIILLEQGGTMFTFEGIKKKCPLKVCLRIHSPQFYWKIVTQADLGLADAYINGEFSFTDTTCGLLDMITILILNGDLKDNASQTNKRGWWTPLFTTALIASAKYSYNHVLRQNTLTQARRNISRHYDLSNELFSLFLDETMTYSCAIFKSEDEDLKTAQMRKTDILIEKARVDKNHEVLEIGFGWGNLAIEIVKQTGCKYTGITLSKEQLVYAEAKVKEAGLQEQITFLLCDYRKLPKTNKYDRIISCEAIEHVGHVYYEEFFGCCESLLAQDGILVLQFTSVQDAKYDEFRRSPGFIKEYIFPGMCLPSLNRLTTAMAASSRLCVDHAETIGSHYYQTLRVWRENFIKNQSKILALGFNQQFIRTWEYYFDYAAAGFKTESIGNYQIVFSRPGINVALGDRSKSIVSAN
ncbi:uncharacterized protein [Rutidosis leptorrhynchoides]|uniref:uncharacterized protein n=1 Tax=Rutidosis leptorrhynchoides TaxID=125765 RepID=UPI003A991828